MQQISLQSLAAHSIQEAIAAVTVTDPKQLLSLLVVPLNQNEIRAANLVCVLDKYCCVIQDCVEMVGCGFVGFDKRTPVAQELFLRFFNEGYITPVCKSKEVFLDRFEITEKGVEQHLMNEILPLVGRMNGVRICDIIMQVPYTGHTTRRVLSRAVAEKKIRSCPRPFLENDNIDQTLYFRM